MATGPQICVCVCDRECVKDVVATLVSNLATNMTTAFSITVFGSQTCILVFPHHTTAKTM